jgi:C_GCAxxG_C_C family probable redox protein
MKDMTEKERKAIGEKAYQYHKNGFHCAEAVVAAVLEAIGEEISEASAHATAFGGGFGRTRQEACGVLSGALIVIGHLHGRRKPGGRWDRAAILGAKIHRHFLIDYGTTRCETLCNRFSKEDQEVECKALTKEITLKLLAILMENSDD